MNQPDQKVCQLKFQTELIKEFRKSPKPEIYSTLLHEICHELEQDHDLFIMVDRSRKGYFFQIKHAVTGEVVQMPRNKRNSFQLFIETSHALEAGIMVEHDYLRAKGTINSLTIPIKT